MGLKNFFSHHLLILHSFCNSLQHCLLLGKQRPCCYCYWVGFAELVKQGLPGPMTGDQLFQALAGRIDSVLISSRLDRARQRLLIHFAFRLVAFRSEMLLSTREICLHRPVLLLF